MRVVDELQADFALNQPLSAFALAAIELLDKESESYAVDVLSVLEATLDDPQKVLFAQQRRARRGDRGHEGRGHRVRRADGVARRHHVAAALAPMLEAAYDIYAGGHPWIVEYPLRPKSVARELHELSMTFVEYIGFHKMAPAEGLVLRYLADAYKALRRTVPAEARTEELDDLTEWLGELVRQVDSSLLDEWEQLLHPDDGAIRAPGAAMPATLRRTTPSTSDFKPPRLPGARAQRHVPEGGACVAAALGGVGRAGRWRRMGRRALARGDGRLLRRARRDRPGTRRPRTTPTADRGAAGHLAIRQIFDDPAGDHDWGISAEVDLAASDAAGEAVVRVTAVDCL